MPAGAQNWVVSPWQMMLSPVISHGGGGLTVRVRQQLLMQPFSSVTVTQYSPATLTVMHCVFAVKPPGPVHA
jgi:hypothetical protein